MKMTSAWRPPGHARATWRRLLPTRAPTASAFCGVARGWPQLCTRTALSRRGAHGVPGSVSQSQGADRATAQAAEVKAGKTTQTMTPLDALWASHTDSEATRCRMHRRRTGRGCASCAHAMAISRAGVRSLFAFQKATISARPQQDRPQTQLHVCAHAHVMCISAGNISAWFRCLGACPTQSPGKPLLGPDVRPDHQALVPPPPGLRRLPPRRPRPVVALPRPRPLLPHARCAVPSRLRLLAGAFFQDHRRFNSTINGLDDSPIACSEARRSSATRAEINAQTDSRGDRYRSTDAPSRTGSQNKH